jgi:ABC-type sulfate transport system permease subunit
MQLSDGGKGSAPRTPSVSHETFASNWDRIFAAIHQPECDWKFQFHVVDCSHYKCDNCGAVAVVADSDFASELGCGK